MKLKTILATLLAVPAIAIAGVNGQNGDFYITYGDITLNDGHHELAIDRTYNSLSPYLGWFGSGWGTKYETHLTAMTDGSVAVQENGSGQIIYYRAKNKADIKGGVASIVKAVTTRDKLSPSAADALSLKLIRDEYLRVSTVRQYGLDAELPVNTNLTSIACPSASIVRLANEYKRTTCNDKLEYFDLKGHLVRLVEDSNYSVGINYQGSRPSSIKDSNEQSIQFKWTNEGLLADATSSKGQHIVYTYDKNNDLTGSNELEGNEYGYEYDSKHNLTRIIYIDKSSMLMEYTPTANGVIKSITTRSGDKTSYEYRSDPKDAQHTWTKVTATSIAGKQSSNEYEYQNKITETGEAQIARFSGSQDDKRTDIIYDDKGRISRKSNGAGGIIVYTYHPQSGQLITVVNNELKTEFKYDEKGNVIRAENNNGQVINLDYANTKQIQRMLDVNLTENTRHELTFKYNKDGHPTEITLVGTGKINVEYDDKGEISKVDSNGGMKIALQVSQAFQNLQSVLNVAGARF